MMRRAALFLCFALSLSARAGTFTTFEGIEYARVDGKPLLMDVRVPHSIGLHPAILYLHSGAWITGDRTGGPAIRQATRDYVVASIDYRLAPAYRWPSQIEDAKAAVRFLRANAQRFHIDPDRIVAFGTSAGGHLASMLGTTSGRPEFEGLHLGNPEFSSDVTAVVSQYGVSDLLKLEDQKLPCYPFLDGNASYMPPSLLMGCSIQNCREKTEWASPITHAASARVPFLLMHGQLDCLVAWQQSQTFYDALKAAGAEATLYLLPTAQHADHQFNSPENKAIVDAFLDRVTMKPKVKKVRK